MVPPKPQSSWEINIKKPVSNKTCHYKFCINTALRDHIHVARWSRQLTVIINKSNVARLNRFLLQKNSPLFIYHLHGLILFFPTRGQSCKKILSYVNNTPQKCFQHQSLKQIFIILPITLVLLPLPQCFVSARMKMPLFVRTSWKHASLCRITLKPMKHIQHSWTWFVTWPYWMQQTKNTITLMKTHYKQLPKNAPNTSKVMVYTSFTKNNDDQFGIFENLCIFVSISEKNLWYLSNESFFRWLVIFGNRISMIRTSTAHLEFWGLVCCNSCVFDVCCFGFQRARLKKHLSISSLLCFVVVIPILNRCWTKILRTKYFPSVHWLSVPKNRNRNRWCFQIAELKSQVSPQVPQKNRGMKSQIAAFWNCKFKIATFFVFEKGHWWRQICLPVSGKKKIQFQVPKSSVKKIAAVLFVCDCKSQRFRDFEIAAFSGR